MKYLPAVLAFALAFPAVPLQLRALIGVGLALYLALHVEERA